MTTLGVLAQLVGGEVIGNAGIQVSGLADLASAGPQHLSFLTSGRYRADFERTRAAGVLVGQAPEQRPCTVIVCEDPYLAMATAAATLHPAPRTTGGCHPSASVHPEAALGADVSVGPTAVIERGASVGDGCEIGAGCFVGAEAHLGPGTRLHPGARVLHGCTLGARVILHAGVVVGSDGFGFAVDRRNGTRHKIPQVGTVIVGDDVEVGANSTIDRATFGATRIGAGTKIDNLVQIAHNVELGRDCVVVSQTGIAGSTRCGNRVIIGAQGGLVGHITVADDVVLGARAGVASNIEAAGIYSGAPAMPHRQWLRMVTAQQDLGGMRRRLRALEREAPAPPAKPL